MVRGHESQPGWRRCRPPTHRDDGRPAAPREHRRTQVALPWQRLRAGVRLALTLAEHDGLKELIGPLLEPAAADVASDAALDAWLLHQVTTYSHISGTCKMGPGTDPMTVVDQYGKVHGLEGLRIVDASIMPNLVRAPINPTVVMMGERLAALMRQGK